MNLQNTRSLKRTSLHEELADELREMIVKGDLAPGTKVPEKDLCAAFNVSRTPLREALKVLAAEGLVALEPNRGAWVSQITEEDIEEVFPVMGALEALSGELACQNITDAEITQIRRLHDAMWRDFEARKQDAYFATNQRIHEMILAGARNPTLTAHYRALSSRVSGARFIASMTDERWRQAMEEHEVIIQCLETRDAAALAAVLKDHLRHKLETVRTWLHEKDAHAGR
ncbi:MAG: GntR family transcriptional regulator [Qingshengfaniella sp.]